MYLSILIELYHKMNLLLSLQVRSSCKQPLDSISGVKNCVQRSSCININLCNLHIASYAYISNLLQSLYIVIANCYVAIPVNILINGQERIVVTKSSFVQ